MFGSEIYGTRKLKMAPPSFFVLIFGDKDTPELQVEPLSRHFTENAPENSIELVVNVYNICYSENNRLLKRSKTLREYSMFIYFVNEYLDREMSLEEAVAASVKRAKKEGILVDFLNKYATEVEGMLTGITVEKYGEVMKKEGFEDGKAAGIAQGVLPQLCLDAAQAVGAPHGAAAIVQGQVGIPVLILQEFPQLLPQRPGEPTVESSLLRIYRHIPLLAAAIRAASSDAVERIIKIRLAKLHRRFLSIPLFPHKTRPDCPHSGASRGGFCRNSG